MNERNKSVLRVVMVGHVDHGKSTIVGRLLHETGSLPDGKVEAVAAMSKKRGMPFEWAFVTDALQAERDQGITIDASHIRLRAPERDYVLVDAPGHREFIRNMITGAATSDAALLVIDAAEGAREQSRRHGFLLDFLGIRQVVVAVNKMDLVSFDEARFRAIETEFGAYLAGLGIQDVVMVPISARGGDNVARQSSSLAWYGGPTLLQAFARFRTPAAPVDRPLRLPVQDVYKFDERRILAGTIQSGRLGVGDELMFSPSNKRARVTSIEAWPENDRAEQALAGEAVGITLDQPLFLERGELASHIHRPPVETDVFRARLFWLAPEPLRPGAAFTARLGSQSAPVVVQSIERMFDAADEVEGQPRSAAEVPQNAIADVVIRARRLLALDAYAECPTTGRVVLTLEGAVVAGGLVSMDGYPDQRPTVTVRSSNLQAVEHRVTAEMRARRNGHQGAVLWLTGLSGAGKSTIAIELEKRLFERGVNVYALDGDNVRSGLNSDLGFSPEDRAENVRRLGAAAALFADAGFVVLVAAISPYRADRARARSAAQGRFHEVWVKADLATCEGRDPKGLYKRARAGQIAEFTGISAPYEAPEGAEIVVDTSQESVEISVDRIMTYLQGPVIA